MNLCCLKYWATPLVPKRKIHRKNNETRPSRLVQLALLERTAPAEARSALTSSALISVRRQFCALYSQTWSQAWDLESPEILETHLQETRCWSCLPSYHWELKWSSLPTEQPTRWTQHSPLSLRSRGWTEWSDRGWLTGSLTEEAEKLSHDLWMLPFTQFIETLNYMLWRVKIINKKEGSSDNGIPVSLQICLTWGHIALQFQTCQIIFCSVYYQQPYIRLLF